jgi:hypothetical protein
MKKRITVTIDDAIYDEITKLPRKVSISEMVNFFLKVAVEEIKEGREMGSEELRKFVKQMPGGGDDFLERMEEHLGPKIDRIEKSVEKIKNLLVLKQNGSVGINENGV